MRPAATRPRPPLLPGLTAGSSPSGLRLGSGHQAPPGVCRPPSPCSWRGEDPQPGFCSPDGRCSHEASGRPCRAAAGIRDRQTPRAHLGPSQAWLQGTLGSPPPPQPCWSTDSSHSQLLVITRETALCTWTQTAASHRAVSHWKSIPGAATGHSQGPAVRQGLRKRRRGLLHSRAHTPPEAAGPAHGLVDTGSQDRGARELFMSSHSVLIALIYQILEFSKMRLFPSINDLLTEGTLSTSEQTRRGACGGLSPPCAPPGVRECRRWEWVPPWSPGFTRKTCNSEDDDVPASAPPPVRKPGPGSQPTPHPPTPRSAELHFTSGLGCVGVRTYTCVHV